MLSRRDVLKSGILISSAAISGTLSETDVQATAETAPTKVARADIAHGPRSKRQIALTFHGAGADSFARNILDQVKEAGVSITVMAVGSWVNEKPQWAKRIITDGHDLGNHTMHHLGIKHMSLSAVKMEITKCSQVIKKHTGQNPKWFRPSQTQHSNQVIRSAAGFAGFPYCISYSLDSLDYQDPAVRVVQHAVLSAVQPGDIVSMHLGHKVTTQALPKILSGLHDLNLKPVTITQLLKG